MYCAVPRCYISHPHVRAISPGVVTAALMLQVHFCFSVSSTTQVLCLCRSFTNGWRCAVPVLRDEHVYSRQSRHTAELSTGMPRSPLHLIHFHGQGVTTASTATWVYECRPSPETFCCLFVLETPFTLDCTVATAPSSARRGMQNYLQSLNDYHLMGLIFLDSATLEYEPRPRRFLLF